MWPDNQANGFVSTLAADLPHGEPLCRHLQLHVDDAEFAIPADVGQFHGDREFDNPLPANSLNGDINTYLSNNVLTTKITPELTNKLSYRFYDFDNETPQILFNQWISYDQTTCANTVAAPCRRRDQQS